MKSGYSMTVEELCRESKKQRKADERRGYRRAVREIERWTGNESEMCPLAHLALLEKLGRMKVKVRP